MPLKRMAILIVCLFAGALMSPLRASPVSNSGVPLWQFTEPAAIWTFTADTLPDAPPPATASAAESAPAPPSARTLLAAFAGTLRNIRYRRGGREPSTGFDCSGFVRYVFRHIHQELPSDSASQFRVGTRIDRDDLKTGDLVFFRTRGKRISHVGIYLDNGRFIHSPSTGKRVSISNLDEAYWLRHFAGAKRPQGLS